MSHDVYLYSSITALAFIDRYPILIAADNNGGIALWAVRPHVKKYKCLVHFLNANSQERGSVCPVLCMTVQCKYSPEICKYVM